MTFLQAKVDLLDIVNRPQDEIVGSTGSVTTMLDIAGRELNNAIRWANRRHIFKLAEKRVGVTYTAGTFSSHYDNIGTDFLSILSVEQMANDTQNYGNVLHVRSFDSLSRKRLEFDNRNKQGSDSAVMSTNPTVTYGDFIRNTWRHVLFTYGEMFGLYPTPSVDVYLMFTYNSLLPDLVLDADTNFMLKYGYDFILSFAAKRFNIYLKDDDRLTVNNENLNEDWSSMLSWDSAVRAGTNVDLGGNNI